VDTSRSRTNEFITAMLLPIAQETRIFANVCVTREESYHIYRHTRTEYSLYSPSFTKVYVYQVLIIRQSTYWYLQYLITCFTLTCFLLFLLCLCYF